MLSSKAKTPPDFSSALGSPGELESSHLLVDSAILARHENYHTIFKNIFKTTAPMLLTQATREVSLLVGGIILARVNENTLSASAVIFTFQNAILYPLTGPMFSVHILASQKFGAATRAEIEAQENQDAIDIGTVYQQGKLAGTFLGLIPLGLSLAAEPIFLLLRQDKEIVAIAGSYFRAFSIATVPMYWLQCSQQFADAINQQKVTATFNILTFPILIFLGYGLTFGKLGMPALGANGFAYAFAAQTIINVIGLDICLLLQKKTKPFKLLQLNRPRRKETFLNLMKLGWPISVQIGSDLTAYALISLFAGKMGNIELAAQGIIAQYNFLALIPVLAMQNSINALVGRHFGAENYGLIKPYNKIAALSSIAITLIPFTLSLIIPSVFALPYLNDRDKNQQEILDYLKYLLPLYFASLTFEANQLVNIGSCRGVSDTKIPMLLTIVTFWALGTPLIYSLGFIAGWGVAGLAIGRVITLATAASLMFARWECRANNIVNNREDRTCWSYTDSLCGFFSNAKEKVMQCFRNSNNNETDQENMHALRL